MAASYQDSSSYACRHVNSIHSEIMVSMQSQARIYASHASHAVKKDVEYPGSEQSSSVTRFQVALRDLLETDLLVVGQVLDTIKPHSFDIRHLF